MRRPNWVAIAHENYNLAVKQCRFHELIDLRLKIKEAVKMDVEDRQRELEFWTRFWKERKEMQKYE